MRPSLLLSAACLLLSASLSTADSAADYFVSSLPGQPDGPLHKQHAGHIEVDPDNNGHLFFWHFENRHIADRRRTVIWLNGGPGCSSLDGALMEVGPYRVTKDGKLEDLDGSWHEFANLLFVDQPVGTGFSYVNTDHFIHELNEMSAQFMTFLEKFFALFPEYEADDLYFAGESYAGQHIPFIAHAILKRNRELSSTKETKWNVKGLLIGNGWIDPIPQYHSYLEYAYAEGVVDKGSKIAEKIEKQVSVCDKTLDAATESHVDVQECETILNDILDLTQSEENGKKVCYNMYDIRKTDSYPSCGMNWPPDLEQVTPYLRRKEVTNALHINPDKKTGWQECSGSVGHAFRAKKSRPSIELLPEILEEIPIVLFSGDRDLICNHLGTEASIHGMTWNGGTGFEVSPGEWAPRQDWTFEGEKIGYYQTARNLTYTLFYNSSHMVAFDVPRRSRDMLDRFMGVDISSIGGDPTDSRIGGEKSGKLTQVGAHPNSTKAEEQVKEKVDEARWRAYYKSGQVALVVVIIAAVGFGVWVWRGRRKEGWVKSGYEGVRTSVELEEARGFADESVDQLVGKKGYEGESEEESEEGGSAGKGER